MATIIQIKRSSGTTTPSSLKLGELAYTYGTGTQGNNGDRLFLGIGGVDGDGNANEIAVIGGQYFQDKLDHVDGTLTASSAITVDSNKAIDEILVGNSATIGGTIKFNEGTNNGAHFVALKAPNSVASDITYTLPGSFTNGHFLKVDGSGNLSFAEVDTTLTFVDDSSTTIDVPSTQSVKISGGTGLTSTASGSTITLDLDDTAVTPGSYGSATQIPTFTVDQQGRLTAAGTASVATTLTIVDETSTSASINLLSDTLKITGGEGIDTTISGDTITISGEDASTSNKGVASFDSGDFSVSSGAVSIKTGGVSNDQLAGSIANDKLTNSSITIGSDSVSLGATQTDLNGITSLDVDNITIDGNTISTTNANGDLILDPNGSGDVDVNNSKIINVATPTADNDAANKAYVDGVVNGLDVKESVQLATTGNLTATYDNGAGTLTANSNGALSVDGVTPSVDDRILVKDQSTQTQNGIYKVTTVGDGSTAFVLTRSPDADTAAELTGGTFFFVEQGTANADNGYVATHNGTPTFGVTSITFSQFSGAGQISAGDALTKTGNQLDVAVDDSSIEISSDALRVKALGITNGMLAGSIENAKLTNSSISIGGVTFNLGDTDATPALDLSDATNYPASSLSGTIANNQLANSIISFSDDSSTTSNIDLGSTFAINGGEGIDATISGNTLTIAGELATTSNIGVASFNAANFAVSSGDVTVATIDGGTF